MGTHLIFLIALISVPLSMVIGSDTLYMVMAPIFAEMSVAFGGTAIAACCACTIGACIAANLCMVAPTPYLALGLAGVEMKDNLKYCFLPTWILGIVLAIVAGITGAIPF
jgi:CitMHS family citrate-Mg2+:H+ or citrate-Ca2+:H+ symporter